MTPDQRTVPHEASAGFSLSPSLDRRSLLLKGAGGAAAIGAGLWLPRRITEARQTEATPETLQNYPPEFGELLQVDPEIAETAQHAFDEQYPVWVERWVVAGGSTGEKRAVFNPDEMTTNSETHGIAMELAAQAEDWEQLDGLVTYLQAHRNRDGLMVYEVHKDGTHRDDSSVVDGDLTILQALLHEAQKRGNYTDLAREYAQAILDHDIHRETFLFQGGNDWGGPRDGFVNPSYNITGSYLLAHDMFPDERWLRVKAAHEWLFDRILEQQSETGLLPNWSAPDGSQVSLSVMRGVAGPDYPEDQLRIETYGHGYEAPRIFQRVGTGAFWYGSEHDKQILTRGAEFFASQNPSDIYGVIDIKTGEPLVGWPESLMHANAAIALSALGDVDTQQAYLAESIRIFEPDSPYVTNQAEPLKAWKLLATPRQ